MTMTDWHDKIAAFAERLGEVQKEAAGVFATAPHHALAQAHHEYVTAVSAYADAEAARANRVMGLRDEYMERGRDGVAAKSNALLRDECAIEARVVRCRRAVEAAWRCFRDTEVMWLEWVAAGCPETGGDNDE